MEANLHAYWSARKNLRVEIAKVKMAAWDELIASIDQDPWDLLYRLMMKRLSGSMSLTETLQPDVLERLLDKLFSNGAQLRA